MNKRNKTKNRATIIQSSLTQVELDDLFIKKKETQASLKKLQLTASKWFEELRKENQQKELLRWKRLLTATKNDLNRRVVGDLLDGC